MAYILDFWDIPTVCLQGKETKKRVCTVSVDQLHIQLPQLPQLLFVGPKHLVRKHVHLEHLAQYAIDEQRSLLVEDALPRPFLPATRDPVGVFHQFRGVVGQVEEVEGAFGFGGDVGEVLLDPGPGEGFDFEIAGFELGISVQGPSLGWLHDVGGDNIGLVVLVLVGYRFTLSL